MARRVARAPGKPALGLDAQHIARERRHRLARRSAALAVGVGLVGVTIVAPPVPRLVWNASASAPIGLYSVRADRAVGPGDMVIARVPERHRMLAARRHYLPVNVPLVKRIAGVAGDEVCALGAAIIVNGQRVAVRRAADGRGRAMPRWTGCVRLRAGQLFLLMADSTASFDGRCFGISERRDVVGKARLLWAKPNQASDDE